MPDITSNLICHLPMQDNAASSVVAALAGTNGVYNSAQSTPANTNTASVAGPGGPYARALATDGVNDYTSVTNNATAAVLPFSICCWAKLANLTAEQSPLSVADDASGTNYFFGFFAAATTGVLNIMRRGGGTLYDDPTAYSFVPNQWAHIGVAFHADNTKSSLYVNGQFVNTYTGTAVTPGSPSNDFVVGKGRLTGNYRPASGAQCDARFYNRHLAEADFRAIYELVFPASEHGVIGKVENKIIQPIISRIS